MLSAASSQEVHAVVIRVSGIECGYPGHAVLKDLSFSVERGEFVGILGPNGAGKSTLLHALSGVVPVQAGSIEILGTRLDRLKHRERARRMAVIAQDSDPRFPYSCEDVVRMGRYPHQKRWQLDSPEDENTVRRALEITDTESLAKRLVTAVSGGEKQRVVMARALAQDAPVLLLDEATSAMDIHRKLQIFRVLDRLNAEDRLTVISVLHDVNLAALFCRRMIFLKDGSIVADGPVHSVLTPEVLEKVYETRVIVQEVEGAKARQVVFLP